MPVAGSGSSARIDRRTFIESALGVSAFVTLPGIARAEGVQGPIAVRIETAGPFDNAAAHRTIVAVSQAPAAVFGSAAAGRTVWVQVLGPSVIGRGGQIVRVPERR